MDFLEESEIENTGHETWNDSCEQILRLFLAKVKAVPSNNLYRCFALNIDHIFEKNNTSRSENFVSDIWIVVISKNENKNFS